MSGGKFGGLSGLPAGRGKFADLESLIDTEVDRVDSEPPSAKALVDAEEAAEDSAVDALQRALVENPVRVRNRATVAVAFRLARTLDAMPADAEPGKVAYLATSYTAILKQLGLVFKP